MDTGVWGSKPSRRCEKRYAVGLHAETGLVQPGHLPGTPVVGEAVIEDLSMNGACLSMQAPEEEQVRALSEVRNGWWVFCKILDSDDLSFLSGRIAWIDVNVSAFEPNARIGASLVETKPHENDRRARVIRRLARED